MGIIYKGKIQVTGKSQKRSEPTQVKLKNYHNQTTINDVRFIKKINYPKKILTW